MKQEKFHVAKETEYMFCFTDNKGYNYDNLRYRSLYKHRALEKSGVQYFETNLTLFTVVWFLSFLYLCSTGT